MAFALNGTPLQRARVTVPKHGVWEGSCATAGQLDLAVGAAVSLEVGDLTLKGYVVAGGTFEGASESTYTLAGGVAGWTAQVPPRALSSPSAGVKLLDVVTQLAADAGERFDTSGISPTTILGDHWQRPAGLASVALSQLFPISAGGWRVDPDGTTRPGPRAPAPLPLGLDFAVEDAPRDRRWARVGIADDRVSAFLPGAIVVSPNMPAPLVVGELTVRAEPSRVVVEVLGEGGIVELFAALVLAVTPPAPLTGEYRYQVADADTGAVNLTALSTAAGLPPVLACAKVFGVPGVTATLAPGSVVLVSFQDGSPARPCVTGYVTGTPLEVDVDAQLVKLGPTASAVPLARADRLATWSTLVVEALATLGQTVPSIGSVATTAVLGS